MMPGGPAVPNSGLPGRIVPGFRPAYVPPPQAPELVSSPPVPPPQQFTNAGNPPPGGAALPNQGLTGQILPGFGGPPPLVQMLPADPPGPTAGGTALPNTALAGRITPGFSHENQPRQIILPYPPVTIFGVMDGVNRIFTWGVVLRRADVFRNGVLQTLNVDVCVGPTSMTFLPGSEPQPGDILTMRGWV